MASYPAALGLTPRALAGRVRALAGALGAAHQPPPPPQLQQQQLEEPQQHLRPLRQAAWARAVAVVAAQPGLLGCSPGSLADRCERGATAWAAWGPQPGMGAAQPGA